MSHSSDPTQKVIGPYRLFFPMGILFGLIGVSVWPLYALGWMTMPPPMFHMDLQIQGFLLAFILGFLMTALPRFSQTWHASLTELSMAVLGYILGNMFTIFGFFHLGRCFLALNLTVFLIFAGKRISRRKANPPVEFLFVGVGLVLGWCASVVRLFGIDDVLCRRLLSEGMVLMLVLGVSGRLSPMFFGFLTGSPIVAVGENPSFTKKHWVYLGIAFLIVASFPIEYLLTPSLGLGLRALAASFVFVFTMKLHRSPKSKGVLVSLLRCSNAAVFLALWAAAFMSQFRLEVLHVLFIGGFAMMSLTIATRVILSHGNYPTDLEKNSIGLAGAGLLLFASLVFRVLAASRGVHYFQFLGIAGGLWMMGLVWWGWLIGSKTLRMHGT